MTKFSKNKFLANYIAKFIFIKINKQSEWVNSLPGVFPEALNLPEIMVLKIVLLL